MNIRMFAAFPFVFASGLFACAPVLAQSAMPASAASTMSQDSMHKDAMKDSMHKGAMKDSMHKDAMKGSVHKQGMMMKKGAMQKDMVKHTKMRKNDAMKTDKTGSKSMSGGG